MGNPNESEWSAKVTCSECGHTNRIETDKDTEFWICSECGSTNRLGDFALEESLDTQIVKSRRELSRALDGLSETFSQMSRNEENYDPVQHQRTRAISDIIKGVSLNLDGKGGIDEIRRGLDELDDLENRLRRCPLCEHVFLDGEDEGNRSCPNCGGDMGPEGSRPVGQVGQDEP